MPKMIALLEYKFVLRHVEGGGTAKSKRMQHLVLPRGDELSFPSPMLNALHIHCAATPSVRDLEREKGITPLAK